MLNFKKPLSKKNQRGQGMVEYAIIVALIAVAAITVVSLFGSTIQTQFAGMAEEMSGKDAASTISKAEQKASNAVTASQTKNNLGNYNNDTVGN